MGKCKRGLSLTESSQYSTPSRQAVYFLAQNYISIFLKLTINISNFKSGQVYFTNSALHNDFNFFFKFCSREGNSFTSYTSQLRPEGKLTPTAVSAADQQMNNIFTDTGFVSV